MWGDMAYIISPLAEKAGGRVPRVPNLIAPMLVKASLCCIWKARATSAQGFTLWQKAMIEITCCAHSIIACSRHIYMGVVVDARHVCGELHIQHNANREVAKVAARLGKTCGNDRE